MDILFWVVVIVAAALIALVIVTRTAARSRVDPTQVSIDPAVALQVRQLYAQGDKVQAIKVLRGATGLGLADAVRIADKLAAVGRPTSGGPSSSAASGSRLDQLGPIGAAELEQIRSLLADNRKIDAIKLVRELTGMSLQQAKHYVESL